jgi:predicted SAM-dependent methyltransferase
MESERLNAPSPTVQELTRIPGDDRLHIGGKGAATGWKLLNIQPGEGVDYVGDIRDLSQFADASFDAVYGSHVLEHVGYQSALGETVRSIHRILRPGGKFFVSVPDLDVLCRLFANEKLGVNDRFHVMRMMFGGQMDEHDFHYVGLNADFLAGFLQRGGFGSIYRVPEFGIFNDTSSMRFQGVPISLNMIAIK